VRSQYTPLPYYVCLSFLLDSGQHVELHSPNPPPHVVGYIHTRMSPVEVARNAVDDARSICSRQYGSAPDVHIYGDPDFTFP
jgi:pyruvate dehydrogenase kinase 2/3/4